MKLSSSPLSLKNYPSPSQRRGSLQVVAMKKDIHPKYNAEAKVKRERRERRERMENVEISCAEEKRRKSRPSSSASASPLVSGQNPSPLLLLSGKT